MELDELIQQRKAKAEALKAKGMGLYPAQSSKYVNIGLAAADF